MRTFFGKELSADDLTLRQLRNFVRKLVPTASGCWKWEGATNNYGYGIFRFGKKTHGAHRVAYAIFNGPIPEGDDVDHCCNNKLCCNPAHLQLLSRGENATDANVRRGCRYQKETLEDDYKDLPI